MRRLDGLESRSRILPDIQAILKRVGFALLLLGGSVNAQPPDTMWTRVYPGAVLPRTFALTNDGGVIIAGTVDFPSDAALTKIDEFGNVEWSRVYDTDNWVTLFGVTETQYHNIVAVGLRFGNPHHFDFATYLICTDSDGDTVWTREINLDEDDDQLRAVMAVEDGLMCVGQAGLIGASSDAGDILIMKLDFNGDTLWTKRYGSSLQDRAYSLITMPNSRFLAVGASGEDGPGGGQSIESFALLLSDTGDSLWMNMYSVDYRTTVLDADNDNESGFAMTGIVRSTASGYADIFMIHADSSGAVLWQNRCESNYTQWGLVVQRCRDGGFAVIAAQGSTDQYGDRSMIYRLNSDGDSIWTAYYTGQGNCAAFSGLGLPDGGYMILGSQSAPSPLPNGMMLIRTYPEGLDSSDPPFLPTEIDLIAYPNPFNVATNIHYDLSTITHVELVLFDLLGRQSRVLENGLRSPGSYDVQLVGDGLASGLYLARLVTRNGTKSIGVVLLK